MTKEAVFKDIQKELGKFFVECGFRKVKGGFIREFPDSLCVLNFVKLAKHGDAETIAWRVDGGVAYTLFNPIFRPDREPLAVTTSETDRSIFLNGFGKTTTRLYWETTAQTDVSTVLSTFKKEALPVFSELENPDGIVSLHSNIDSCLPNLTDPTRCSVKGLLDGLIAAKYLNRAADYVLLLEAIKCHPQGQSEYMQRQLKRVSLEESVQLIDKQST